MAVAGESPVIVWIASYPRSGSNLFLLTLARIYGARSGSTSKERLGLGSLLEERSVDARTDAFEALRELEEPVFLKTHKLSAPDDCSPAVYLVRDGRDSLVSYAHFVKAKDVAGFEFMSHEEAVAALIKRKGPWGTWSAHVRSWTHRDAPTEIVRFENLVNDPIRAVRRAVEALGIRLPEPSGRLPSFDELRRKDPVVYRRGVVGAWKSEMPQRLERKFWRRHGAEMRLMGYPRDVDGVVEK